MSVEFKRRVGRPRAQPKNSKRINIAWLSKEQIEFFKLLGNGNLSVGVRRGADILIQSSSIKQEAESESES